MSERPAPAELETWDLDMTKLPVGTRISDDHGIERIVRQHFTDPAGPYTWATQPKKTTRGLRYDRRGKSLVPTRSSIVLPETAVLPAKADGQEIDLLWLPVGTRFKNGHGQDREIAEIDLSNGNYPIKDDQGRTYTATGRLYAGKTGRRRREDMVIGSIVLPKRQRLAGVAEFAVPGSGVVSLPVTLAKPVPAFTEPKPEPQPEPEAEPTKTITDINQLNSWEW